MQGLFKQKRWARFVFIPRVHRSWVPDGMMEPHVTNSFLIGPKPIEFALAIQVQSTESARACKYAYND